MINLMNNNLYQIAQKIMSPHKGILASDERPESADKNLEKVGIIPSDEIRKKYRELFINTPGIEQYLSGMIMHEETFWQKDNLGVFFRDTLKNKGISVIIKLDEGLNDLQDHPGEKVSIGLDTLNERAQKFFQNGAVAAKWRSVIKISDMLPSDGAILANADVLSRYAAICQEIGLVPIVEPEVLIDGDHTIEKAEQVTTKTLSSVFDTLTSNNIDLKAVILKTSMVTPGNKSAKQASPEEIAEATVRTLLGSVPKDVAGVVFLSGGQSPIDSTLNLNYIARKEPLPWEITFSYLRAIEGPAIKVWQGKDTNIKNARDVFMTRLRECVMADAGIYQIK